VSVPSESEEFTPNALDEVFGEYLILDASGKTPPFTVLNPPTRKPELTATLPAGQSTSTSPVIPEPIVTVLDAVVIAPPALGAHMANAAIRPMLAKAKRFPRQDAVVALIRP
jgi:hypothetical protein